MPCSFVPVVVYGAQYCTVIASWCIWSIGLMCLLKLLPSFSSTVIRWCIRSTLKFLLLSVSPLIIISVEVLLASEGVMRGAKGAQLPGRLMSAEGAEKVPTMSQVLSSIQYICFRKTSGSNMVAKLVSPPGHHLTQLRPCARAVVTSF